MEIPKVSSVNNQNYVSDAKQEEKVAQTPKEVKEGKKKLALALIATGAIAAAGVAIYKQKTNPELFVKKTLNKINKLETSTLQEFSSAKKEGADLLQKAENIFKSTSKELVSKATKEGLKTEINGAEYIAKKLDDNTGRVILTSVKDGISTMYSKEGLMLTVKSGDTKLYLDQMGGLSQLLKGYSSKNGIKEAKNLYNLSPNSGSIQRCVQLKNQGTVLAPIKGKSGESLSFLIADNNLKISGYNNPKSGISFLRNGEFLDEGIFMKNNKYKINVTPDGKIEHFEEIVKH